VISELVVSVESCAGVCVGICWGAGEVFADGDCHRGVPVAKTVDSLMV
jgi:hypothetical protein